MVEGKCRATCGKCIPATYDSSPGWGGYGRPLTKVTGEPMSQCSATNLLTKIKSGASSAVEEHTVSEEELAALDASFEKRIEDNKQLAKSSTLRQPANLIHCTETAEVVKGADDTHTVCTKCQSNSRYKTYQKAAELFQSRSTIPPCPPGTPGPATTALAR